MWKIYFRVWDGFMASSFGNFNCEKGIHKIHLAFLQESMFTVVSLSSRREIIKIRQQGRQYRNNSLLTWFTESTNFDLEQNIILKYTFFMELLWLLVLQKLNHLLDK